MSPPRQALLLLLLASLGKRGGHLHLPPEVARDAERLSDLVASLELGMATRDTQEDADPRQPKALLVPVSQVVQEFLTSPRGTKGRGELAQLRASIVRELAGQITSIAKAIDADCRDIRHDIGCILSDLSRVRKGRRHTGQG